MKIAIVGSRTFDDYQFMKDELALWLAGREVTCVISGGASGADALAERWAKEMEIPIVRIEAEWHKYGKAAGPKRNQVMAELCDEATAFWDGVSRGTSDMVDRVRRLGKIANISYFRLPKILSNLKTNYFDAGA